MQVLNNVPAYGVWVNYTASVRNMQHSLGRMSSGARIMGAEDDPAGLAMSERMRAQIRNSSVASQNIQNQQALLRTTDSWLQKIHDILHRMSELAVSANDGTKTDTDRANLQTEFEQMQQELVRITSTSLARGKFNARVLFQGLNSQLQVGPDPGQLFCGTPLNLDARSQEVIGNTHVRFQCGQYAHFVGVDGERIDPPVIDSRLQPGPEARWSMILSRGGDRYFLRPGETAMGIHISTLHGAERAGALLNLAVDYVSRQRALVGAAASRLNQTLDGLQTYSENISSAESQIRDADLARESTALARHQILTEVGTAMLAQANALPQNVLQLIG